ncbi:MAG: PSD1 and planctomycete cytochrome C domain-containing protein [Pirellulales bacterium]
MANESSKFLTTITAACFAFAVSISFAAAATPEKLSFNRDVRPILSENCFACHGFDAKKREADLRLDTAEGALAARESGAAIVPGNPEASEVWKRIVSDDPDVVMPPQASHKTLKPEEKAVLKRWIAEGAAYQKHWAFERPATVEPPQVDDKAWSKNPIDRFLRDRLQAEGLSPQPEADRPTLIRRVAFALTGLPPTIAEVDKFVDDKSPDAYERMVDRYLASPRFGEEMARHWLDVARYADTHGLHLDNERTMFAYRDWVIRAFNENLPFDDFTVWQLAGDQLPNPTQDQQIATGFNRCNVTTSEGGSIAAEFLYRYAVDRASTTMQTWMGLTGGCAVCHDHKYDPLTQKEFYSFYSFFYDAADPAMDGNINTTAPFLKLPTADQQNVLDAAAKRKAEAAKTLEAAAVAEKYVDPANGAATNSQAAESPIREVIFDDDYPLGTTQRNTSRNASRWLAEPAFGARSGRRVLEQANARFHQEILTAGLRTLVVPTDGKFEVWVRPDSQQPPTAVSLLFDAARAWWGDESAIDNGIPGLTPESRRGALPKPGVWTKLTIAAADLGLKPGTRIKTVTLQESGGIVFWDDFVMSGQAAPADDPLSSFAAWRKAVGNVAPPDLPGQLNKFFTAKPPAKKGSKAAEAQAKKAAAKTADADEPTTEELQPLVNFYAAYVQRGGAKELTAVRHTWEQARLDHAMAEDSVVGTMTYADVAAPREAFVMMRGQYDQPGEKVEPGVPAAFPALSKTDGAARLRRLDLARWLVAPEHPTTARIQANRLWQQFFGVGLVKTSEDFGSQGTPPSHPELLDWLAVDFQKHGWDTKRFVRQIVTSQAFRQTAKMTPDALSRDPENRLLARGSRFRLDAEQIRDNALYVSGLINLEMGGEGVKTYQPPNIWEPVGYADSNTRYYLQDHGASLYRRSIYAFLKRTAPPPFMSNFDGPNREQMCSRRERSNTPLQALQLMNDVQHFEAARALAERTLADGGNSDAKRISFLYRSVLAREPQPRELSIVGRALAEQRRLYAADPKAAKAAIDVGESKAQGAADASESAAWTLTANLILNLDETLNRN